MGVSSQIAVLDQQLAAWHAESEASRRLAAIPGLGVIAANAIAAIVTDPDQFRSGRQFAAWLGLTPQQHSTGGKSAEEHTSELQSLMPNSYALFRLYNNQLE